MLRQDSVLPSHNSFSIVTNEGGGCSSGSDRDGGHFGDHVGLRDGCGRDKILDAKFNGISIKFKGVFEICMEGVLATCPHPSSVSFTSRKMGTEYLSFGLHIKHLKNFLGVDSHVF